MHTHEVIEIKEADDPRISVYRSMRDRALLRDSDFFIAEGENLVLRLAASRYPIHSVLMAANRAQRFLHRLPETVRCFIASEELLAGITGFQFHRGVVACGQRLPLPDIATWHSLHPQTKRWVVLCDIQDAENLGVLLRTCAAFAVDAVLLDSTTVDPFYRRVIRVSMGAIFSLAVLRSSDISADLNFLHDQAGAALYATVLAADAIPVYDVKPADAWALLLGNEHRGLEENCLTRCQHKITLPMREGIDSLNVAIAGGIFIYHFTRPG